MTVPTALRHARQVAHLSQARLGRRIGYSLQMVSAVETGGRSLAPDVALAAAHQLDDPELYMALAEEATGGVMVAVVLDGPRVDLHRLATGRKLVEETAEALEALATCDALTNCRTGAELDADGRRQVARLLHQVAELQTCAGNTLRAWCRDYGFSPAALYREHVAELVQKGYATPRLEVKGNAKAAS